MERAETSKILLATMVSLILAFAPACTKKGGGSDPVPGVKVNNSGTANGGGYGGKLAVGDYFSFNLNRVCVQSDTGQQTHIDGIVHVAEDQSLTYYEGCEKKGGRSASLNEFKVHGTQATVLSSSALFRNFEFFSDPPYDLTGKSVIEGICDVFAPYDKRSDGSDYMRMDLVIRHAPIGTVQRTIQANYTLAPPGQSGFVDVSEEPKMTTVSALPNNGLRYDSVDSSAFSLVLDRALGNPPRMRSGQVTFLLDNKVQTLTVPNCLFGGLD